jgi:hypothetical protein
MLLAFQLAGAALGSSLLGAAPIAFGLGGGAIGMIAGGLLGNALLGGTHTEGPKITDLTVQASTYGTPIPHVWGTYRVSGNIIWSTEKRVRDHEESVGKGGGSSVSTQTADVDIAIALCAVPAGMQARIRKIYRAGKLVADFSDGGSVATWNASAVNASGVRFYPGDEAQLPDSLIEADKGVGNVPAHRGLCYVVFEKLDLPNGQIPQLSFEVVIGGTITTEQAFTEGTLTTLITSGGTNNSSFGRDGEFVGTFAHSGSSENRVWAAFERIGDGETANLGTAVYQPGGVDEGWGIIYSGSSERPGVLFRRRFEHTGGLDLIWMGQDGSFELYPAFPGDSNVTYRKTADALLVFDSSPAVGGGTRIHFLPGLKTEIVGARVAFAWSTPAHIYIGGVDWEGTTDCWLQKYDRATYEVLSLETWTTAATDRPTALADSASTAVYEASASSLWLACGNQFNVQIWRYDGSTWTLVKDGIEGVFRPTGLRVIGSVVNIGHLATSSKYGYTTVQLQAVEAATITLGNLILQISALAGLPAEAVDVTGLDDEVQGYAITRVGSARAALDPLMAAYSLDARETGGKVEFLKRWEAELADTPIPFDDLGACEQGGDPAEPFELERTNAGEMPRSLAVNFIDQSAEYEPGSQLCRRQTVSQGADAVLDLPIVFQNGDQPAQIAQRSLFEAWMAQNTRKLVLPPRWSILDPGDDREVEYPRGSFTRCRFMSVDYDGQVARATVMPIVTQVYTNAAAAKGSEATDRTQQVTALPGDTRVVMLDIPILRDADDSASPYVAMSGYRDSWGGAGLFAGPDEGSLQLEESVSVGAAIGTATNALGSPFSTGLVDESNTLTVRLLTGSLVGTTHARMLASKQNTFALGADGRWEICQFRDATDNGDGTWTLRGILRARRGTERNTANHVEGDTFVLLDGSGLIRPGLETGQLNVARTYEAISIGNSDGDAFTFTTTGESLMPLPPANLRTAKQANGDIVFSWVRRSRLSENWLAGVVPLGEASEAYTLNIPSRSRTLTSNTRSVTYTAAQQAADGGTFTSGVVTVAQVSATVGAGHALSTTVNT